MKVSVYPVEKYTATERTTGRNTTMWRANWAYYTPTGQRIKRKRGGFTTKGRAEAFADLLRDAASGKSDDTFDSNGNFVSADAILASDPNSSRASHTSSMTVFEIADRYGSARLPELSPGRRAVVVGRLVRFVSVAVRPGGALTPRARRYLESAWLRGPATEEHELARNDIGAVSLPVDALDYDTMKSIFDRYTSRTRADVEPAGGRASRKRAQGTKQSGQLAHNTRRSYFAVVRAMFRWAADKQLIERNPAPLVDAPKRNLDDEIIDPETVPTPAETFEIAAAVGRNGSRPGYEALILVMGFGGLRIGEACSLTRSDVEISRNGDETVVWLSVCESTTRVTRAFSDGDPLPVRAPKGHQRGRRRRVVRRAPVTGVAAERLVRYVESLGEAAADDLLFRSPRGRRIDSGTFRSTAFNPAVDAVFTAPHPLRGLTPHALRKSATSNWLRAGVDERKAQEWGGWKSLEVMRRFYDKMRLSDDVTGVERLNAWLDVQDSSN